MEETVKYFEQMSAHKLVYSTDSTVSARQQDSQVGRSSPD